MRSTITILSSLLFLAAVTVTLPAQSEKKSQEFDPLAWKRPVDNPVFTTEFGNNHDSILFVEPEQEYPYHLIISHTPQFAQLWRTKTFSWTYKDWELVEKEYKIGNFYEYDDGVKVGDTYYIYEAGKVFTYTGPLESSSGKWKITGSFPAKQCDDIGVYHEDGVFHIFGEHGNFPHGPDGTSLAHFTSPTGLGGWTLVNTKAVDPNPDGGHKYGVGDATIAKIGDHYYIYCDRESKGSPYKVVAWRSRSLDEPFEYLGKAITPRSDEVDDWDNHRIQDADIGYIPELGGYVLTCNMMDVDGNPGGNFPTMKEKQSRVIGVFYHDDIMKGPAGILKGLEPLKLTEDQKAKLHQWLEGKDQVDPSDFARYIESVLHNDQREAFRELVGAGKN